MLEVLGVLEVLIMLSDTTHRKRLLRGRAVIARIVAQVILVVGSGLRVGQQALLGRDDL